jgi:hypothetical protein
MVGIRGINPPAFLEWLLKNNKKIDLWCRDEFYVTYLHEYLRREAVQDALERALKEMQAYADEHEELRGGFKDYFRYANANRICYHISTGRVSPWIVYNCGSGHEFLESLEEQQLAIVLPWIDPDYWQRKLKDYTADTEWIKDILARAGL